MSEKHASFSDMKKAAPSRPTSTVTHTGMAEAVRARVAAATAERVFSPADFTDLGSRAAVDKVLSRLTTSGGLRRIARGLYDRPRTHPVLGPLLPAADDIARALAGKGQLRLQPSGAYAANLLGLTEQVPLKLLFLTDGASRTVRIGEQQILLRHTTPRNMATAGRVSGLVIQALRHLKQPSVDESVVKKLHRCLSADDKAVLRADAPLAPAWIARIMQRLASGGT